MASSLQPLRERVNAGMLIVGLGFLAYVLGSLLAAMLLARLHPLLARLPWSGFAVGLGALVAQLWAYAVVPLFCFAAGRAFNLTARSASLGMLATGAAFLFAITLLTQGLDGMVRLPWPWWAVQLSTFALGAWWSHRAFLRGKNLSARAQDLAKETARLQADEYAAILKASEELAAKNEERLKQPRPDEPPP